MYSICGMGFELKTKILKNQKGTSIVEFAIILPLLIILIFGMVEFSVLFYDKAVLTNASREGARGGIVFKANSTTGVYEPLPCNGSGLTVETVVNTYLANHLVTFGAPTTATTQCLPPTSCAGSGSYFKVTVTYNYTFLLLPNFLNFLPSPFTLTAVTTMRCE